MIETFVSRPNWAPEIIEHKLTGFYSLLKEMGFKANTIGKSDAALTSPFESARKPMESCRCAIILGLPHIFVHTGKIKKECITSNLILPTEWNQIEATMSLMLKIPTLVLLHKNVAARGVFDRGSANVFVHEFDSLNDQSLNLIAPALNSLKHAILDPVKSQVN